MTTKYQREFYEYFRPLLGPSFMQRLDGSIWIRRNDGSEVRVFSGAELTEMQEQHKKENAETGDLAREIGRAVRLSLENLAEEAPK